MTVLQSVAMKRRDFLVASALIPFAVSAAPPIQTPRYRGVTVLFLDGKPDKDGDIFDSDTEVDFEKSVPIFTDSGAVIGSAFLRDSKETSPRRMRRITATLQFSVPHESVVGLSPSIRGTVFDLTIGKDNTRVLKSISISDILVSTKKNIDPRITPLE